MILYKKGDIFQEEVEAIVNPVNCVGVMGAGLALKFKEKYPLNFSKYREMCNNNEIKTGKVFVTFAGNERTDIPVNLKYVINFPTKKHWKNPSKEEYITTGLNSLIGAIKRLKINSIAIPALGCGLGGLRWNYVKSIISESLKDVECKIIIFEPVAGR